LSQSIDDGPWKPAVDFQLVDAGIDDIAGTRDPGRNRAREDSKRCTAICGTAPRAISLHRRGGHNFIERIVAIASQLLQINPLVATIGLVNLALL
jgi:hypothetical protein